MSPAATRQGQSLRPFLSPRVSYLIARDTRAVLCRPSLAFKQPRPGPDTVAFEDFDMQNPARHIYSRETQELSGRVEKILSAINVTVYFSYMLAGC
jgi:hypothetical protein